jgi:uncharacterized membrane protein
MTQNTSVSDNDKLMAALGYVIGVIVPLIILLTDAKNRPFQRYHAVQSLGISAATVVLSIVMCILQIIIGMIPVIQVLSCLLSFWFILPLVVMLYYAYKAYQGEMFVVPVLTDFLKQQKWL